MYSWPSGTSSMPPTDDGIVGGMFLFMEHPDVKGEYLVIGNCVLLSD
jgi:hypothetical protein